MQPVVELPERHATALDLATYRRVIYACSGDSGDHMYGLYDVIHTYGPEVRGTSFQPPTSNIGPSNAELWAGMIAQVQCADEFRSSAQRT